MTEQPWLQLLGSVALDLVRPDPRCINSHTVGIVLARTPRFAGHTDGGMYSVAQHSREGALAILRDTGRRDAARAFFIHDWHEFAMGDIATPIVDALAAHAVLNEGDLHAGDVVKRAVKSLKGVLDRAIHKSLDVPFPLPADVARIVKDYDRRMCLAEWDGRMGKSPRNWTGWDDVKPIADVDLAPYSEGTAHALFMDTFRELFC